MNIRTKLILSVGILAGMIILLVALSVVNLQILTATEPDDEGDHSLRTVPRQSGGLHLHVSDSIR